MADYTVTTDFSVKDALSTTDPEKIVLGADFDVEYDNIATAIATKFDSVTGAATLAQAQAGVINTAWMSPVQTVNWAESNGGLVESLRALAEPVADVLLGFDFSDLEVEPFTMGNGISITTNAINIDHDAADNFVADEHVAHSSITLTAGDGLSGGGTLDSGVSFAVDLDELGIETAIAAGDFIAMVDITDGGSEKITFANFEGDLTIANMSDYSSAVVAGVASEAQAIAGTADTVAITPHSLNEVFFSAQFLSGSTTVANESAGWSPTAVDSGTGRTTVTHGLGTANYTVIGTVEDTTSANFVAVEAKGATTFELRAWSHAGALVDSIGMNCLVMKY